LSHFRATLSSLAVSLVAFTGCLPKDTRPPPSLVHVTASPSEATRQGMLTTSDGWTITLSRAVIAVGRVSLDGDNCTSYSEAGYSRVLSLRGAPDKQKLSDSYALGHCSFGFGVTNADTDSLLGAGTTDADKSLLREPGSDKYAGASGTSFLLEGTAEKSGQREQFSWRFRARARFEQCKLGAQEGLDLAESGDQQVDILVAAEGVFRLSLESGHDDLGFDTIAAADTAFGNNDGTVTLDELGESPLSPLLSDGTLALGTDTLTQNPTAATWLTLEDFVYEGAAPTVAHYQETGQCTLGGPNRRGRD
jgi:hypothetical protein